MSEDIDKELQKGIVLGLKQLIDEYPRDLEEKTRELERKYQMLGHEVEGARVELAHLEERLGFTLALISVIQKALDAERK